MSNAAEIFSNGVAIKAAGLTKEYKTGHKVAVGLKDASFEIPKGKITLLVGPDGAGKSSFLKMCVGISTPTEGTLTVLSLDVMKNPQEIQNRICYMSQKFGLYEDLSVYENLKLYSEINNLADDVQAERIDELLKKSDLLKFKDRMAGKLSGGMKQKLALICSMLNRPELLILDEPCVGVDPLSRKDLWSIIVSANEELKSTVVVSTAYIDEIEYADYVYLFNRGEVFYGCTPEELKAQAKGQSFAIEKYNFLPRLLQGNLLEKTSEIIDAVPRKGKINITLKDVGCIPSYLASFNPQEQIPEAEDGFMSVFCKTTGMVHQFATALPNVIPNVGGNSDGCRDTLEATNADDLKPIIEVKDLYRTFGSFVAVNRTSFKVYPGEVFGLLGPNGAGKTTTFRMLCGLLPASGGYLKVAGHNLLTDGPNARKNIGYVAQKFSLYADLTVKQNLDFFARVYGLKGGYLKKRFSSVIEEFQLHDVLNQKSGNLPFGYKQRLSMAVGTIHEPKILFLDEPTSGIDPFARRIFWHQITDLSARGTTIIITTHFLEEAEYCDRMMIQDAGKMIAYGTPDEVRKQGGAGPDYQPSMDEVFLNIVMNAREAKHE